MLVLSENGWLLSLSINRILGLLGSSPQAEYGISVILPVIDGRLWIDWLLKWLDETGCFEKLIV